MEINTIPIMKKLENRGIVTRPGIMAIHTQPYYIERFGKIVLPETEKLLESAIILPFYPDMSAEEQNYVIGSILEIIES